MGTVKGEAEDSIYAYTASSYNANVSVENLTYAGYIMNTRIDGSEYASSYNDLFIIYTFKKIKKNTKKIKNLFQVLIFLNG